MIEIGADPTREDPAQIVEARSSLGHTAGNEDAVGRWAGRPLHNATQSKTYAFVRSKLTISLGGTNVLVLLHVGLALDLHLHTQIYQPFHLNERGDR